MQKQSFIRMVVLLAPLLSLSCTYEEAPLGDAGRFEFEGPSYGRAWSKKYIKWVAEDGHELCFILSGSNCQISDKRGDTSNSYEKKSCRLSTSSTSTDYRFSFLCVENGSTAPCSDANGAARESTTLLKIENSEQPTYGETEFSAKTWGSDSSVAGTVTISDENLCGFAAAE